VGERPDIVIAAGPGPDRDTLVEALSAHAPVVVDDPPEIALGPQARLLLAAPDHIEALRSALGPGAAIIGLLGEDADPDAALRAGADEVVAWPGSARVLEKRVATFLEGQLGPSRVVLDTTRVTSLVHAIRNPLNVITLYSELLKMEPLSEDALGSVGRLVRSAKRVDALVGELETLLYLEAGLAPVRPQPVELGEVVRAVLAELAYDIEDKPLEVSLDLGDAGTVAQADPELVRRAVHAVLGRVMKLCLGGAKVEVRTRGGPPRIEVAAPIEPVPLERAPALHAAATELDARESLGGVGVGLSFVYRALSAMGGALEHDETADGRALTRLRFAAGA
jgi:signal transduction histidine kinase